MVNYLNSLLNNICPTINSYSSLKPLCELKKYEGSSDIENIAKAAFFALVTVGIAFYTIRDYRILTKKKVIIGSVMTLAGVLATASNLVQSCCPTATPSYQQIFHKQVTI